MSEPIFEQKQRVKATETLMSFDGCPNRCRDGFYIDPYRHKRVRCDYCYDLRKRFVKSAVAVDGDKTISKALRLEASFLGYGSFDQDSIWPKERLNRLDRSSVSFVQFILKRMIEQVSLGVAIGSSILLNFGEKAHSQNFISPFLVRSYISGLSTSPMLTGRDLVCMREYESGVLGSGLVKDYADLSYSEATRTDTCLVYLDAGSDSSAVMAAKGLMQLRAWSGKSTVILTDYYGKDIFNMCEDFPELHKEYIAKNTDAQNRNTGDRIINGEISSSKDLALFVSVYEKFTVDLKDSQGDVKSEPQSASLLKPLGSVGVG